MYGTDDRVITLINKLDLQNHMIEYRFDKDFNYLVDVDYNEFEYRLKCERRKSLEFLKDSLDLVGKKNEKSK